MNERLQITNIQGFSHTQKESEKPEHNCGIIAFYTPNPTDKSTEIQIGGGSVQHRGPQGFGTTQITNGEFKHFQAQGLVSETLTDNVIKENKLDQPCKVAIVHCRYGTDGGSETINYQPFVMTTDTDEKFAIAHNGQIKITQKMRDAAPEATQKHSDTYYLGRFIAASKGKTIADKLLNALPNVEGAYSLVIGTQDNSLLLTRDKNGLRPLIIGGEDGKRVIASETRAFDEIGMKVDRELQRGEVAIVNDYGIKTIQEGLPGLGKKCLFEGAYIKDEGSLYSLDPDDDRNPERWLSEKKFRQECGKRLAREAPVNNADLVIGIPNSGIPTGEGFSGEHGTPYIQAIIRNRIGPEANQRLFQAPDINVIQSRVLRKLLFDPDLEIYDDKVIVLADDSAVRGNVSKEITAALRKLGAKEIHWRFAFPPISYTCRWGVSIRSEEELIATRNNGDLEKIAKELGANSVYFISPEGILKARYPDKQLVKSKDPREIFPLNGECGHCITGLSPEIGERKEGIIYRGRQLVTI